MPNEAQMWRDHVRPVLSAARLDPLRIENAAALGTPDVNYLLGWIELKSLHEWPKRAETVVRIEHFTPQQRVVLARRWRVGGHAWLLVRVVAEFFLFDGFVAAKQVGRTLTQRGFRESATVQGSAFAPELFLPVLTTPRTRK